jgi:hypothetical protein
MNHRFVYQNMTIKQQHPASCEDWALIKSFSP